MNSRPWLALLLLAVAACGATDPPVGLLADLARAERAWARAGIDSYTYAIERHCFCPSEWRGPVRVRVEQGVVTQRTYVGSGDPVPAELADAFPAVPGLFGLLLRAIAQGAHRVSVEYDARLGVPLELYIDYSENAVDEEMGMSVTEGVAPIP